MSARTRRGRWAVVRFSGGGMVTWRRRTLSEARRDAVRFGGVVRHWKRNMRPTWWPRVNGLVEPDDDETNSAPGML